MIVPICGGIMICSSAGLMTRESLRLDRYDAVLKEAKSNGLNEPAQ